MAGKEQHEYAVYLFQQGFYEDAVKHLDEVLREEETGERWNDWATAQFGLSHFGEAERGFRRALEMNPDLAEAATNFGAMLMTLSRWSEAIGILEGVLPKLDQESQSIVGTLIEQGRAQAAAPSRDSVKSTR
jgi:tetratricopeptide (TPR) repeat protein